MDKVELRDTLRDTSHLALGYTGDPLRQKLSISPQYFSLTTQQLGHDKSHGQKRREGL